MAAKSVASHFDLAVLGADDPLGEAFLKVLEDSDAQVGRLFPLVLEDAEEGIVAFRGEEWPCLPAQGFDFSQAQALVVASPLAAAERVLEAARAARPAMPVLAPRDVVPGPALAVARVLRVLTALGGTVQAEVFAMLPAALAGKAGVEELIDQSRGLFNMETPDPETFPLQLAFNLIPLQGKMPGRYAPDSLAAAIRAQVAVEELGCSAVWAPVLYGGTVALHARFARIVEGEDLRLALKRQDGICLMESDLPAGNPTPATDSGESADIFLGQLGVDGRHARIWMVFDPLRLEALQMAAVVENWIERPANSVLT